MIYNSKNDNFKKEQSAKETQKKELPFKAEIKKETYAREIAYKVLFRCESQHSYSNLALDSALSNSELSDEDKRFCTRLVYGVIERSITLDYIISQLSNRPIDKIEISALILVRMGIYQMRFMDRVPAHASVDSSVEISHKYSHKATPFINATLRAYADNRVSIQMPQKDSSEYLSVTYSVSKDICDLFTKDMGREKAEEVLASFNDNIKPTIRINTLMTTKEKLLSLSKPFLQGAKEAKTHIDSALKVEYIPGESEFASGLFFVQDEASQICAKAVGAIPGERILDACACPGGKSFSMAINMENRGQIVSCDLHKNKLSLISSGAEKLKIDIIEVKEQNGSEYNPEMGTFDRILCDVPCSGTGVIAKKPEIRLKDKESLSRLPETQLAILSNTSKYLKSGGVLVYSTCALDKAENEDVVNAFLKNNPDYMLEAFCVGDINCPSGMLTLTPSEHKTDGFFIAKMKRK